MFPRALCVVALAAVFAGVQGSPLMSWFPWPSGDGKSNNQNLNWVLDEILKSISSELIKDGGDEMELKGSALNASKELDVLWWKVQASVTSEKDGTLKNLSSLIRSSDAGIFQEVEGGSLKNITLKAELSLKDLEVEYPSAKVEVWKFSFNGGLSVSCPENLFDVAIEFSNGDSCPATVQSASIKSLSDCYVKLSEGGVINWFKQHILSYAFGQVIDVVKNIESEALPDILTPIVQRHNICKFLNPTKQS